MFHETFCHLSLHVAQLMNSGEILETVDLGNYHKAGGCSRADGFLELKEGYHVALSLSPG